MAFNLCPSSLPSDFAKHHVVGSLPPSLELSFGEMISILVHDHITSPEDFRVSVMSDNGRRGNKRWIVDCLLHLIHARIGQIVEESKKDITLEVRDLILPGKDGVILLLLHGVDNADRISYTWCWRWLHVLEQLLLGWNLTATIMDRT